MGQTIIFKDDGILAMLEDPVEAGDNAGLKPHIDFREVGHNFALPVNLLDDGARLRASLRFTLNIGARAVGDHQQARRPGLRDCIEDPLSSLPTIEDDEGDRSFHGSTLIHPEIITKLYGRRPSGPLILMKPLRRRWLTGHD